MDFPWLAAADTQRLRHAPADLVGAAAADWRHIAFGRAPFRNSPQVTAYHGDRSRISLIRRSHWSSGLSSSSASEGGSTGSSGGDSATRSGSSRRGATPFPLIAARKQVRPISASFHRETGMMILASRSIAHSTPLI